MRKTIFISLFFAAIVSCGEKEKPAPAEKEQNEAWTKTELYFGLPAKNDTADFRGFADTCISKLFPDGYTLVEANGYWRPKDSDSTLQEPAMVMLLIHKNTEEEQQRIGRIIASYKKRFQQESVLRFDYAGMARF